MKTFPAFLLYLLTTIHCFALNPASHVERRMNESCSSAQTDSLLFGIQVKIYQAFTQSMASRSVESLQRIGIQLENLQMEKKNDLIVYWMAYLRLYSSIYFLNWNDKVQAEKEIDSGIELMQEIDRKNTEDYALLAYLQSFSIQFKGMKAISISQEVKDHAQAALNLDQSNIRAWYVLASNDFYTPVMVGGGKKAEEYLLTAISLPAQKIMNDLLPSWGREESYELLVRLYIKKEEWENARNYLEQGMQEYPDSYILKAMVSKLPVQ